MGVDLPLLSGAVDMASLATKMVPVRDIAPLGCANPDPQQIVVGKAGNR